MKSNYKGTVEQCEEALCRDLTEDEKDHIYVMSITGSLGFQDLGGIHPDFTGTHSVIKREEDGRYRPERKWEDRYVCKAGNPIEWQYVAGDCAREYVGIMMDPNAKNSKMCYAQFMGKGVIRIPMTVEQAEKAVMKMVSGKSMLKAVESSLGIPLTAIQKKTIINVMRNKGKN